MISTAIRKTQQNNVCNIALYIKLHTQLELYCYCEFSYHVRGSGFLGLCGKLRLDSQEELTSTATTLALFPL